MTNEEMRKRLEEAADIYAKRIWNNLLEVHISKTDFLAGAEYGYKEAISQAKEWLGNVCEKVGFTPKTITQCVEQFETDMLKLLEDKK